MKLSNQSEVPVYTISGSNTARPLPEWLARRRKRSLKDDPEYASRVELLQDFEFEEASQCVRVSEDGEWVMSTGMLHLSYLLSKATNIVGSRHIQAANSYPLSPTAFSFLGSAYGSPQHHLSTSFFRLHQISSPPVRSLSRIPHTARMPLHHPTSAIRT